MNKRWTRELASKGREQRDSERTGPRPCIALHWLSSLVVLLGGLPMTSLRVAAAPASASPGPPASCAI